MTVTIEIVAALDRRPGTAIFRRVKRLHISKLSRYARAHHFLNQFYDKMNSTSSNIIEYQYQSLDLRSSLDFQQLSGQCRVYGCLGRLCALRMSAEAGWHLMQVIVHDHEQRIGTGDKEQSSIQLPCETSLASKETA
jgi:hypothetical protein